MQLILISGRSGSGKSAALNALEDSGFCCIDNLPARFLPELLAKSAETKDIKGFAVSIDVRTPSTDLKRIPDLLCNIEESVAQIRILYLDASTDMLVKRFSETRRKHPLSDQQTTLAEALQKESVLLEEISEISDLTINTDQLTHYDLQNVLRKQFNIDVSTEQQLIIESFGFKYGVSSSADYLFDVRCLPNPHWIPELRGYTGIDGPVIDYLSTQNEVDEMQKSIQAFLDKWITQVFSSNRSYITVAIGCTGGKHRSVYIAEQLYKHFKTQFENVQVRHRELQKRPK